MIKDTNPYEEIISVGEDGLVSAQTPASRILRT